MGTKVREKGVGVCLIISMYGDFTFGTNFNKGLLIVLSNNNRIIKLELLLITMLRMWWRNRMRGGKRSPTSEITT